MSDIKVGDIFTISGIFKMKKNPTRKWWQIYKPKYVVDLGNLQKYKAIEIE